jgi:hypothetical protein
MVASVPELHMRTISTEGTASMMWRAISTSRGEGAPKLVPLSAAAFSAASTVG